jgi:hypothetical protein
MGTLQISDSVKELLEYAEGDNLDEKLAKLVLSDLERRLRVCAERCYEFEKKYGLNFQGFKELWEADSASGTDKYSYDVERDYIEWESVDDEHRLLLTQLRAIKEKLG